MKKPVQQGLLGLMAVLLLGGTAYQFIPALNGGSSLFSGKQQGTPALKVNGQTITTEQLASLRRSNPVLSATETGLMGDDFKTVIVARAIQNALYTTGAKDINVSRADVDAQVKKTREDNKLTDNKAWTDALQGAGLTDSGYRQQVRDGLAIQGKVKAIQDAAPAPTDAELQSFFTIHQSEYQNEARIVARDIVVADQAKAQALLAQAKAGADFAALATANSLENKDRGGALGPLDNGKPRPVTRVLLPTDVATAAFALTGGGLSDVISSGGKYYIVKVEQYLAPVPKTFAEAKTAVSAAVTQQKKDAALETWTDGLQQGAQIEYVDPAWKISDPTVASVAGQKIPYSDVVAQVVGNQQLTQIIGQMAPEQVIGLINSSFKPQLVQQLIQSYAAPTIAKNLKLNLVGNRQDVSQSLALYAARDVKATDADIQKFYQQNIKTFQTPASASVDEASFPNQAQAAAFRTDWTGSGDFTSAATKAGGTVAERGAVTAGDQKLDSKLETTVFSGALRPVGEGSLSAVVPVGKRYSVAYVTDLKQAATQPLSAVRGQIEPQVLQTKQAEAAQSFLTQQVAALNPTDNLKTVLADQAKRVAAAEKAAAPAAGTGSTGAGSTGTGAAGTTGGTTTTAPATTAPATSAPATTTPGTTTPEPATK